MKRTLALLIAFSAQIAIPAPPADGFLTNVADVVAAVQEKRYGQRFDIEGTLVLTSTRRLRDAFPITDGTSHLVLRTNKQREVGGLQNGDTVRARGYIDVSQFTPACARMTTLERLGPGTPPEPLPITGDDLLSGKYDERFVSVEGTVRDAFLDDSDTNFCVLILDTVRGRINATLRSDGLDTEKLASLVNAHVSVRGLCIPHASGSRRMAGRLLVANDFEAVTVMDDPKDTRFGVQNLENLNFTSGEEISRLGRRRVFGPVIAAWGGDSFLVRHAARDIVRVELTHGEPPAYGTYVEAVGLPETDLFFVNLSRAYWRVHAQRPMKDDPPQDVSPADVLRDSAGHSLIPVSFHGKVIRLHGIVRSAPSSQAGDGRAIIEQDGFIIPVDVSANPALAQELTIGCQVAVAGTCVLDTENWRPNVIFPRIKGFFLVPRTPDDITVLARPSWWTPARLTAAVGTLAAVLVGILLWNITLRRQIEKRSRELSHETVARISSELKVGERTRLAMELHDSIVQNLTGVSMEIRSADRLVDDGHAEARRHLTMAVKTLDACRKDLRNCLWDLRNLTLEELDVNDAIRRTLAPHIGETELNVRFNVPRDRFCDNTAHAILNIIRELAVNAVQHGKATALKVAGSIEGDKLLFSVKDNGCGFDPDAVPGMAQGHFGLQGIRDRIESFEGEMTVQSARGQGSKITLALTVPHKEEEPVA